MEIVYRNNVLTANEYIAFESKMGDSETTLEQAEKSLTNQLFFVSAYHQDTLVGIARLIGDGAIFWYINDVWVLPEHQGKGIGSSMVQQLVQYVKTASIAGTSVSICLMCAKGKEGFYKKQGFLLRPNEWEGSGMEMELDIE